MLHTKKYKKHKPTTKKYNNKIKYKKTKTKNYKIIKYKKTKTKKYNKGGGSQTLVRAINKQIEEINKQKEEIENFLKNDIENVNTNLNNNTYYLSIHNTFISELENDKLINILQNFLPKLNKGTVVMFEIDKVIYFNNNPNCNILRHLPKNNEKLIYFTEIVNNIFTEVKNNIIVIFIIDVKIRLRKNQICDDYYIKIIKLLKFKYPDITFLYRLNYDKCKPLYIAKKPYIKNLNEFNNSNELENFTKLSKEQINNIIATNNYSEFSPEEDEYEYEYEYEYENLNYNQDYYIDKCINTIKLKPNSPSFKRNSIDQSFIRRYIYKFLKRDITQNQVFIANESLNESTNENELLRTYKGNDFMYDISIKSNFPSYDILKNKSISNFYLYCAFYLVDHNKLDNIDFDSIQYTNIRTNKLKIKLTIKLTINSQINIQIDEKIKSEINLQNIIEYNFLISSYLKYNTKDNNFQITIPSNYDYNFILFIFFKNDNNFIACKYNFISNTKFYFYNFDILNNTDNIDYTKINLYFEQLLTINNNFNFNNPNRV